MILLVHLALVVPTLVFAYLAYSDIKWPLLNRRYSGKYVNNINIFIALGVLCFAGTLYQIIKVFL
jgi:hypothetical protein